jgi:hypothetical protein
MSIAFITFDIIEVQMITKVIVGGVVYIALCWAFKIPAFTDVVNIIFGRFKK